MIFASESRRLVRSGRLCGVCGLKRPDTMVERDRRSPPPAGRRNDGQPHRGHRRRLDRTFVVARQRHLRTLCPLAKEPGSVRGAKFPEKDSKPFRGEFDCSQCLSGHGSNSLASSRGSTIDIGDVLLRRATRSSRSSQVQKRSTGPLRDRHVQGIKPTKADGGKFIGSHPHRLVGRQDHFSRRQQSASKAATELHRVLGNFKYYNLRRHQFMAALFTKCHHRENGFRLQCDAFSCLIIQWAVKTAVSG